jgi:hypothetical protein
VRYGINIGLPIRLKPDLEKHHAQSVFLGELRQAYIDLYAELKAAMTPANQ